MGLSEETGSARRRDADASEETGSAWRGRSSVFEPTAGKIKDKRDMMGKGTTEESLFGFEATGSSAAEYRKEGNVEFYTQANMHKRKAISCDKVVIKWIDIFWNTFSSVHKTGNVNQAERAGRAASCPLQDDTAGTVTPQKRSNDGLLLAPTGASSACWRKKNRRTTPRT